MMPLEIAPKIYDVGVVDWAVRDFHGYKTERGASYNSYLIMDEKNLFDRYSESDVC